MMVSGVGRDYDTLLMARGRLMENEWLEKNVGQCAPELELLILIFTDSVFKTA